MSSPSNKPKLASKEEVMSAAIAWAEFLYDEYMFNKHKQLLLDEKGKKIEKNKVEGKHD